MTKVGLLSHGLDDDPRDETHIAALLHPAELARAARFAFPHLQRRYCVGRSVLRAVLGRITGKPPSSLVFDVGPHGKPFLLGGPSFNVSHSAGRFLLAVAPTGRLGVDIEILREVGDLMALTRANFAKDEAEAVLAVPSGDRNRAFLEIWTRKEALVKALGAGLWVPLHSFTVALGHIDGSLLRRLDLHGESESGWCLGAVEGLRGAVAAVALDVSEFEFEWLPAEMALG